MYCWKFKKPKNWNIVQKWGNGYIFRNNSGKLVAIIDCDIQKDGHYWIHLSISHKSRLPTYDEITAAKNEFIGEDRYAYFVWPPKEYHVNIHKNCLHIWAQADTKKGQVLPEFSGEVEGVGRII